MSINKLEQERGTVSPVLRDPFGVTKGYVVRYRVTFREYVVFLQAEGAVDELVKALQVRGRFVTVVTALVSNATGKVISTGHEVSWETPSEDGGVR